MAFTAELHSVSGEAPGAVFLLMVQTCNYWDVGSQVDSSLSFLDGFVSEALAAGAAPYKPPHQRQEELAQAKGKNNVKPWDFVAFGSILH